MTETIILIEDIIKEKNLRRSREALSLLAETLFYRACAKNDSKEKIKISKLLIRKILPYLMNYISILPNLKGSVRKELLIDSLDEALTVYKEKFPHDRDNALEIKSWVDSKDFSEQVDKLYALYPNGSKFRPEVRVAYKNRKKKKGDFKTSLESVIDLTQMVINNRDLTKKWHGGLHKFKPYVNDKYKKLSKWIKKSALSDMSKIQIENGLVRVDTLLATRADNVALMALVKENLDIADLYNLSESEILERIEQVLLDLETPEIDIEEFLARDEATDELNLELTQFLDEITEFRELRGELLNHLDELDLSIFKGKDKPQIRAQVKQLLEEKFESDNPLLPEVLEELLASEDYLLFENRVIEFNQPPKPAPKPQKPVIIKTKPKVRVVASRPVKKPVSNKPRSRAKGNEISRVKGGPKVVPLASRRRN